MADRIITGFHGVEEFIRSFSASKKKQVSPVQEIQLLYSVPGPRVKKIIAFAKEAGVSCKETEKKHLDSLVESLCPQAQDHRGLVLKITGQAEKQENIVDLDLWLKTVREQATVVVLDSVTDPHNVGAILRSCDQLGASLVILPERRGLKDVTNNEVVSRSSAGASAWVPVTYVANLNRAIQQLKNTGFWVFGADSQGSSIIQEEFPPRTALVMGSEGNGISRLLQENCDRIISIPTCGKLDSLNVSVATGIILYEIHRQKTCRNI